MPTYSSPASGTSQMVLTSRFAQATPAQTSSGASGNSQMEISATFSQGDPPSGGSGGGVDPGEPEPPSGGTVDTSGAVIPAGRARGRGPTTGGLGRGA